MGLRAGCCDCLRWIDLGFYLCKFQFLEWPTGPGVCASGIPKSGTFLEVGSNGYFEHTKCRHQLSAVFGGDLHLAPMGKVSDKGFSEWHQTLFGIKLTYT